MGWSVGYDYNYKRFVGYGVPCICEHPNCNCRIDRGLSYVCGGEAFGGEHGCGLYFCPKHLYLSDRPQLCERCLNGKKPFNPKPDTPAWVKHQLIDPSWKDWRKENGIPEPKEENND